MNWKILNVFCVLLVYVLFSNAAPSISKRSRMPPPPNPIMGMVNATKVHPSWTKWDWCPEDQFVSSMSLMINHKKKSPLMGIKLGCAAPGGIRSDISAKKGNGTFGGYRNCPNPGFGLAVGIQLRYSSNFETTSRNSRKQTRNAKETAPDVDEGLKGVIDVILYCDDLQMLTTAQTINPNSIIYPAFWSEPKLCGWGEVVCGIRAKFGGAAQDKMIGVDIKCCRDSTFQGNLLRSSYREVKGKLVQSPTTQLETTDLENGDRVYSHHYKNTLDRPYYFKWKFCDPSNYGYSYVTGFQLHYEKMGIRLLCSDMSRAKPRTSEIIQMGDERFWNDEDQDEDIISEEAHCDGVAIGFQAKYHEKTGIQAIRMFCSFSEVEDELSFITGQFESDNNITHKGYWQEPELCSRNQAICGFKAFNKKHGTNTDVHLEHIKLKCCDVPEIAEVCYPGDKYELLVECDATTALADTTCSYSQSEGVSILKSKSLSDQLNEEFHESLGHEWGFNIGDTGRETDSLSSSLSLTNSEGSSRTDSLSTSDSQSFMNSNSSSMSELLGKTLSQSLGHSAGTTNGSSSGSSKDVTKGTSNSLGSSSSTGGSKALTNTNSVGLSESLSKSSSTGRSTGKTDSNTRGISKGTVSSSTHGKSNSMSSGTTRGTSDSYSSGKTSSSTTGGSVSLSTTVGTSVTAKAGFDVGIASGSLETNVHASFTATGTFHHENTYGTNSQQSRESSYSENSQSGSEISQSNTNSENVEENQSNTSQTNQDIREDNSATSGSEANRQNTNTLNSESNFQNNQNSNSETSNSKTDRENSEINRQQNSQLNLENSNSTNRQTNSESSSTNQGTNSKDKTRSNSSTLNKDSSKQNTLQKSTDKTKEWNRSNSRNRNVNRSNRFTSGYDWSQSSSHTWNVERKFEVSMTVPPGLKSQLFQVVGFCAHFNIRTSKYRRVDFRANGTLYGADDPHFLPN